MDGINGIGNNNIWNKGNIGNNAQNKGKNDKIPDESTSFQDMLKKGMQNGANTNTGTNTGANPSNTANATRNNELQDQNIRRDSNGNISNRKSGSEQNTYDGQGNSQISWTNGSSNNILKFRETAIGNISTSVRNVSTGDRNISTGDNEAKGIPSDQVEEIKKNFKFTLNPIYPPYNMILLYVMNPNRQITNNNNKKSDSNFKNTKEKDRDKDKGRDRNKDKGRGGR